MPTATSFLRCLSARAIRNLSLGALAFVGVGVGLQSIAGADNPQRYPFDPACPWGRLGDGHGMLIRCLKPAEASQLLRLDGSAQPSTKPAPSSDGAAVTPAPATQPSSAQRLQVDSVGPAIADAGELPLAGSKLSLPKDRYIECVNKHGGLSAKQGKVVVRFLVRERGRAEGVAVKSHSGMSADAAKCIADVVDRRYVGYPAAPIVGATLPIVMSVAP